MIVENKPSLLLEQAINYLHLNTDTFIAAYKKTLLFYLPPEIAELRGQQCFNGLLRLLEGESLNYYEGLEKGVRVDIEAGENIITIAEMSDRLLQTFVKLVETAPSEQLPLPAKELLIRSAITITKQHKLQVQLIIAKMTLKKFSA